MESVTGNHTAASSNNDTAAADYLDSFPIGYRFVPTEEELVTHYLLNKIKNLQLPRNRISEANIYESHPKDLAANYPEATEGVWYFFSPRERKYIAGKRPRRDAGPGYWRASGGRCDKVIKDNEDNTVGVKKSFAYLEGRPPNATKTVWLMHEYVVKGYERQRLDANDMKLDDYVLCKIYKTGRTKADQNMNEHPPVDQNQNEQADQNMNAVTQNQSMNPTTNPNDLPVDQASNFFQFF